MARRKKRNYAREYARYHSRPEQKKRRAKRNAARRKMRKRVGASKLKGKDVHHRKGMSNKSSNLGIVSRKRNRGFRRSKTGKNLGLRKRRR